MADFSSGQPFSQRFRAFAGTLSRKQSGDGEVFVEGGPMEVGTVAKDLEALTFLRGAMPKARIPSQGHDDRAAIHQINFQSVVRHTHGSGACFLNFNPRRTHATS